MGDHISATGQAATAEQEARVRRLRFRSWHRGTREMDLILGSFADEWLDKLTAEQIESYEALLVENDPDIYNWVTKREPPPAHVQGSVFDLLIDHVDHAEGTG